MKRTVFLSILCFLSLFVKGQIITTIAGTGVAGFSGDSGQAINARLNGPAGMTMDFGTGSLYFADVSNYRIRIINSLGIISTFAGNGTNGFAGNGGQAINAELSNPLDVEIDGANNIYVADEGNNLIRIVSSLGIINNYAGNGSFGYGGDGGLAISASLKLPTAIVHDNNGNLLIADHNNNRIRKVNNSNIISTIAGNGIGSYSGDGGQATAAQLCCPHEIAIDDTGNIYFPDGAARIRKINTAGVISTVAGGANAGFGGDGGPATSALISGVYGIIFDNSGNMFFSDVANNRIRKVDPTGIITTIVGNGNQGYSGDGASAISAELNSPYGLALDISGNLYISDAGNNVIRKVTNVGIMNIRGNDKGSALKMYPNPCNTVVYLESEGQRGQLEITNSVGSTIFQSKIEAKTEILDVKGFESGLYFVTIRTQTQVTTQKLIINH